MRFPTGIVSGIHLTDHEGDTRQSELDSPKLSIFTCVARPLITASRKAQSIAIQFCRLQQFPFSRNHNLCTQLATENILRRPTNYVITVKFISNDEGSSEE